MKEIKLEELTPTVIQSKKIWTRKPKAFTPHTPFQKLLKEIGVDETFTTLQKKQMNFNKFVNNVPLFPNYNVMLDTLYLPKDKATYKYLLTAVDLGSNVVDFEPMKSMTSEEALKSFQKMFKRKYIKKPEFSVSTDNGSEFKSVFDKYLVDNNIFHKKAMPYNHKQQSPVETLNKTIARIVLGYLNNKEQKTKKKETDWTPILPKIREELNKYRIRLDIDEMRKNQPMFNLAKAGNPVFKIGDKVHYRLPRPYDALNNPVNDGKFRKGDMRYSPETKSIVDIVYMNDHPYYRYMLNELPNVSFSSDDLIPSKNKEETYLVKSIWGKKVQNGTTYYKVWWKGYLKKDSTFEPVNKLIEDGFKKEIETFESTNKKK